MEFIHLLVETMDRHFGNVVSLHNLMQLCVTRSSLSSLIAISSSFISFIQCELDIMFHLEKAHFMLEEMVMNGCVVETGKSNILPPIQLMDKTS